MSSMSTYSGRKAIRRTVSVQRPAKRSRVMVVPRSLSNRGAYNGVHEFKRICSTTNLVNNLGMVIGATTNALGSIQFNLSSVIINNGATQTLAIPSYTELSALFDQVKLAKVIVRLRSRNDSSMGTANSAIEIGTCIDYNDADVPATVSVLQQYETYKSVIGEPGGRECITTIKPKWLQLVNYTALLSGYSSKVGFVRSDYDIPHFGMKFFTQAAVTGANLMLEFEYHYECKNIK